MNLVFLERERERERERWKGHENKLPPVNFHCKSFHRKLVSVSFTKVRLARRQLSLLPTIRTSLG